MSDNPRQDPRYADLAKQYEQRPPVRVEMLDYARTPETRGEKRRKHGQFAAGMAAPYLYAVTATALVSSIPSSPEASQALALLALGIFIAGVVCIHLMTSWKSFLPGVLTGIFVLPLAFAAICAIIVTGLNGVRVH